MCESVTHHLDQQRRIDLAAGETGLHADHARLRVQLAQRERDAGDQAAPADWDDDRSDVRELFVELEADRALAGDHQWILEGMDERRSALLNIRTRRVERL